MDMLPSPKELHKAPPKRWLEALQRIESGPLSNQLYKVPPKMWLEAVHRHDAEPPHKKAAPPDKAAPAELVVQHNALPYKAAPAELIQRKSHAYKAAPAEPMSCLYKAAPAELGPPPKASCGPLVVKAVPKHNMPAIPKLPPSPSEQTLLPIPPPPPCEEASQRFFLFDV